MNKKKMKDKDFFDCDVCELKSDCIINDKYNCIVFKSIKSKRRESCLPVERFLGVLATLFGIVLLLPYETFKLHSYLTMLKVASENTWGTMCLFIGLFQLFVTLSSKGKKLKVLSLSLQASLWSFVGTMLLVNDLILGNTLNTGFATYLTIAGLSLFTAHRLR